MPPAQLPANPSTVSITRRVTFSDWNGGVLFRTLFFCVIILFCESVLMPGTFFLNALICWVIERGSFGSRRRWWIMLGYATISQFAP
jgi:hypothetical protein